MSQFTLNPALHRWRARDRSYYLLPIAVEGKLDDLARVHKKTAEARFFLGKMIEQDRHIMMGEREPFDYYLSAFLSAAMSVRGGFHYRQNRKRNEAIKAWRAQWENNLSPYERSLYKFMHEDRVAEVHDSGSSRSVAQERIDLPIGTPSTPSTFIMSSDGIPRMAPAVVYKPTYNFTIDGAERKATEACATYLSLLQKMVAQFEADHP